MIKRKLLKIGLILTLSFTVLTGCGSKENTTAKVDTSTTIEEDTSDTKLVANNSTEEESTSEKESESATDEETTTEVETQKVAEAEVTQPVTEAPTKVVETQPATEAPKPVETQPVTEAPLGSFDNPIPDDTDYTWSAEKESVVAELEKEIAEQEAHSKDDYNWAVAKVAEWKAINPDPAYLIGMFGCYARGNWYYNTTLDDGAFKHAMSYYGNGVCTDIETCFRTFCNVAGIPCERIEDWSVEGGHTWDRVTIDGVQYEVDMTQPISCPLLGQFDDLVEEFNLMYYGNEELGFTANRFIALVIYSYN